MKYFPHVAVFTFFAVIGLACFGFVVPFVAFRAIVGAACVIACCYVVADVVRPKRVVPAATTLIASENLPAGTVCEVDAMHGTIERAAS